MLQWLDCVLQTTKAEVLTEKATGEAEGLSPKLFLLRQAGQFFYNTSPLAFKKLRGDQYPLGEDLRA